MAEGNTFASNPNLVSQLKAHDVEHIVAFGIQSECCVLETCNGALEAGLKLTLLKDAHSTYGIDGKTAEEIEREVEQELAGNGAKIMSWKEWQP